MRYVRATMAAALATLLLGVAGCFNPAGPEERTTWDATTAASLGITGGPITIEQAKQIAEASSGGTAVAAEAGDVSGTEVYVVRIQTGNSENGVTTKEVKVRISDGAVMTTEFVDDDGCHGHDDDDD